MTHKEVAELLKALAANYGKKLDAKTAGNMIDAWMLNLGELEAAEVYKAPHEHVEIFPEPRRHPRQAGEGAHRLRHGRHPAEGAPGPARAKSS